MSVREEKALDLFDNGFNCAQSVLAVFCEDFGLEKETALKLSCGFGGGMRNGEVCGAVSGAVIALGLKYGQFVGTDTVSKQECYGKTAKFCNRFKEKNTTIICKELLECDTSTDEGGERANSENLFKTKCVGFIADAVNILEEMEL